MTTSFLKIALRDKSLKEATSFRARLFLGLLLLSLILFLLDIHYLLKSPSSVPLMHSSTNLQSLRNFLIQNKSKLQRVLRQFSHFKTTGHSTLRLSFPKILSDEALTIHSPKGRRINASDLRAAITRRNQSFPSAVHFILPFRQPVLTFIHYVSVLSAFWMIQPDRLILWYVRPPQGQYWKRLKRNFSTSGVLEERVVFIKRDAPVEIYNIFLRSVEHQSDVMRLDALLLFGGLYLDLDVIVVKSLREIIEKSRKKSFVIGREFEKGLCNGVMLSIPYGRFLALWHLAYQTLVDSHWNEHSVLLPHVMAEAWPELVHVEELSMDRPNWFERDIIFERRINGEPLIWLWWKINFCVHLWIRAYKGNMTETIAKTENSMLAELIRWVLFGQKPAHAKQV